MMLYRIFKFLCILTILFNLASPAVGEEIVQEESEFETQNAVCNDIYKIIPVSYIHAKRGKVVVYKTPITYTPTPDDLLCASIKQFWVHKDVFPDKLTILVIRQDFRNALILQINLKADVLTLSPVNIPEEAGNGKVKTVWTIFKEPMKIISEMIRLKSLPLVNKKTIKANTVYVSRSMLFSIATGKPLITRKRK